MKNMLSGETFKKGWSKIRKGKESGKQVGSGKVLFWPDSQEEGSGARATQQLSPLKARSQTLF